MATAATPGRRRNLVTLSVQLNQAISNVHKKMRKTTLVVHPPQSRSLTASSHIILSDRLRLPNQVIRLRRRILSPTVLVNSKQQLSVPSWRNSSICRDRAPERHRLLGMATMERLKDVRLRTVRQWLLALHENLTDQP